VCNYFGYRGKWDLALAVHWFIIGCILYDKDYKQEAEIFIRCPLLKKETLGHFAKYPHGLVNIGQECSSLSAKILFSLWPNNFLGL